MVSLLFLKGPTTTQPYLLATVGRAERRQLGWSEITCSWLVSVISVLLVKGPLIITSVTVRLDLALDLAKTHSCVLCRNCFLLLSPY